MARDGAVEIEHRQCAAQLRALSDRRSAQREPRRRALKAAGAARSAGCRRGGSIRAPWACRCARAPRSASALPSAAVATTVRARVRRRRSKPLISKGSWPVSPSDCALWPSLNCSGSTPMPIRFERWMRSKLSAITARTPEQHGALGGPVARGAGAVFLAGDDDQRSVIGFVAHGGVIDAHLLAAGQIQRDAPFGAGQQQITQPDVGEGAAHHDLVVAATRAVLIEIGRLHTLLDAGSARPDCSWRCCRPVRCDRW